VNEYEQILLFRDILETELFELGLSDVTVQRFNQPLAQGANSGRSLYFSKIADTAYAFPGTTILGQPGDASGQTQTEMLYDTDWQVSALVKEIPGTTDITSGDLIAIARDILMFDASLKKFADAKTSLLRVESLRSPAFLDDFNQFEFAPSFDFVLRHARMYIKQIDFVTQTSGTTTVFEENNANT